MSRILLVGLAISIPVLFLAIEQIVIYLVRRFQSDKLKKEATKKLTQKLSKRDGVNPKFAGSNEFDSSKRLHRCDCKHFRYNQNKWVCVNDSGLDESDLDACRHNNTENDCTGSMCEWWGTKAEHCSGVWPPSKFELTVMRNYSNHDINTCMPYKFSPCLHLPDDGFGCVHPYGLAFDDSCKNQKVLQDYGWTFYEEGLFMSVPWFQNKNSLKDINACYNGLAGEIDTDIKTPFECNNAANRKWLGRVKYYQSCSEINNNDLCILAGCDWIS